MNSASLKQDNECNKLTKSHSNLYSKNIASWVPLYISNYVIANNLTKSHSNLYSKLQIKILLAVSSSVYIQLCD